MQIVDLVIKALNDAQQRNRELETRNRELETRNRELETRNRELETRNRELETRNRDTETRNRELETRNREFETRNNAESARDFAGRETAEVLRMRERERQLTKLLDDCFALIEAGRSELENRTDQYGIRSGSIDSVLERIQRELGFGMQSALRPPQWTKDDVVLLLRRIQETEKQLSEMKEKHSLLLQEMMQVENERDQANAKQQKAETELMQKEREIETLKAQRMEGGRSYQPVQNFSASQPILGGSQSYPTMYGSTTQYSCSAPILP